MQNERGQRAARLAALWAGTVALMVGGCLAGGIGAASASPSGAAGAQGVAKAQRGASDNSSAPPLVYHGGKLLTASKTYAIYWGPQADFPSDLESGMAQLLGGFGGSNYLDITSQYLATNSPASTYEGPLFDSSQPPTHAPSTATIVDEVAKLVANPDPNAIYFVYTSNFPKLNFCAWHGDGVIGGVTVQVAYMPNTAGIAGCDPGDLFPVNEYSQGTRSIADSTAHEFMESTTDPVPVSGWADKNHQEIGDKCNFVYGAPVTLANRSKWQIQEEWSNAAGGCVQGS